MSSWTKLQHIDSVYVGLFAGKHFFINYDWNKIKQIRSIFVVAKGLISEPQRFIVFRSHKLKENAQNISLEVFVSALMSRNSPNQILLTNTKCPGFRSAHFVRISNNGNGNEFIYHISLMRFTSPDITIIRKV